MAKFQTFERVRMESCRECGRPLTFCSQFKKLGERRVEVCEFCRKVWINGEVESIGVEVGQTP